MWRASLRHFVLLALGCLPSLSPCSGFALDDKAPPALAQALAQLQVPPDWIATTPLAWDTNKAWKDARLEVRRLLALDEASVRQGIKLTWIYAQKGDIGDGHELPMYLFMSGNYAWAAREYPKYLEKTVGQGATHAYLCYASCLVHFGELPKAIEVLNKATTDLPAAPWRIINLANIHDFYGDLYIKTGNLVKAREHYAEAVRLYPTSDQPYGKHLLRRYASKVQNKLDMLALRSLSTVRLRDGSYVGQALGYSDKKDIEVTVTIREEKISAVGVSHEEKIDLNATKIVPQRIVEKQSLQVDAVTGATVTSQAIMDGAFQALKQAGLQ
ncbi:MAG TPA: FMN-binding protein [Candidatus Paceibacterota bacterium]|nr:FMN-binding protein [Verrucomicrobiota bacterium]HRY47375.1 FMN-binding protein [Candidatus Paceibacterota bacterium]HSA00786.1 FMN-binding protein [Candidatus Paceibacterota bacterium]